MNNKAKSGVWEKIHANMDDLDDREKRKERDSENALLELWKTRAQELAKPAEEGKESLSWEKIIILKVGNEHYAFKVDDVEEIMRVPPITMVPCTPPHFNGVINRRGTILPLVDLKVFFGGKPHPTDKNSRVVVLSKHKMAIGLLVESADEITGLETKNIKPPLKRGEGAHEDFCAGMITMNKQVIVLVDSLKLLQDDRMRIESGT